MLGDIINGIDPRGCVQLLRNWSQIHGVPIHCIKGNAEAYLTIPERDTIPAHLVPWHQEMMDLVDWFERQLSHADMDWIESFPDTLRWNNVYLVHDSPLDRLAVESLSDPSIQPQHREWFIHRQGITAGMEPGEWQKLLAYMDAEKISQLFCGHTHQPFYREAGGKIICNVGSVGAPLDGDPRPAWVLQESLSHEKPIITIRRVDYDVSLIHQLIDATPDYPDFQKPAVREAYKTWLSTGIHWRAHLSKNE